MSHRLYPLQKQRLQRSELAVPASNPAMIDKAAEGAADYVFLDLEDAVAPPEKEQARRNAIQALHDIDWAAKGKTVSVRINRLDTHYMYRDVVDVMEQAGDRVHTLLVPKVGETGDLYMVEAMVNQIEMARGFKTRVGLEALIETALGMANVEAIARFGGRLEAMHFGVADFAASMRARTVNIGGLNPVYPGDQWHAAIARMVTACRAYGLRAIDGPFGDFSDPEGYKAAARRAAALGCEGKWAIHPNQVTLANEVFSPTEAEVTKARRIIEELRAAEAQGKGATMVEINPLVITGAGDLVALDAKMSFDSNALYRRPEVAELRDRSQEDPRESTAGDHGLAYVGLSGDIGCIINGAGLAMATMDMIKLVGGEPANFLDIGGGASPERVVRAFRTVLADPEVQVILVNIFAGINRCDWVAEGVVQAYREVGMTIPVVVRLAGINVAEGQAILRASGLPLITAGTLAEAAERAVAARMKQAA